MQGGGRHRAWPAPRRVWDNARELFRGAAAPVAQRRDERESGSGHIKPRAASHPHVAGAAGTRRARMADMRPRLALKAVRSARLAAVDLALAPGECAAVMGPSGSGKSLLLRQVADLDPGEAKSNSTARRVRAWRDTNGAARSFIARPRRAGGKSAWPRDDAAAAVGLVERLGLAPENAGAGARAVTGERQRLGLARALVETAARAAGTNPRRPWIRTPPRVSRPRSAAIWTKAARRCW